MERERTISVKNVIVQMTDPQKWDCDLFGPFLNEEIAEKHLVRKGWVKIGDRTFVDDINKNKYLQLTCVINDVLQHPENVPQLVGNRLVYSEKGISIH